MTLNSPPLMERRLGGLSRERCRHIHTTDKEPSTLHENCMADGYNDYSRTRQGSKWVERSKNLLDMSRISSRAARSTGEKLGIELIEHDLF